MSRTIKNTRIQKKFKDERFLDYDEVIHYSKNKTYKHLKKVIKFRDLED